MLLLLILQRTVIGNYCTIDSNVRLQDSHLWQNVTIESGATVNQSILCDGCTIKKGAVVGKGCIVGKDCVIGEGIVLPEFTRVTLCRDDDEEDDDVVAKVPSIPPPRKSKNASSPSSSADDLVTTTDGATPSPVSETSSSTKTQPTKCWRCPHINDQGRQNSLGAPCAKLGCRGPIRLLRLRSS